MLKFVVPFSAYWLPDSVRKQIQKQADKGSDYAKEQLRKETQSNTGYTYRKDNTPSISYKTTSQPGWTGNTNTNTNTNNNNSSSASSSSSSSSNNNNNNEAAARAAAEAAARAAAESAARARLATASKTSTSSSKKSSSSGTAAVNTSASTAVVKSLTKSGTSAVSTYGAVFSRFAQDQASNYLPTSVRQALMFHEDSGGYWQAQQYDKSKNFNETQNIKKDHRYTTGTTFQVNTITAKDYQRLQNTDNIEIWSVKQGSASSATTKEAGVFIGANALKGANKDANYVIYDKTTGKLYQYASQSDSHVAAAKETEKYSNQLDSLTKVYQSNAVKYEQSRAAVQKQLNELSKGIKEDGSNWADVLTGDKLNLYQDLVSQLTTLDRHWATTTTVYQTQWSRTNDDYKHAKSVQDSYGLRTSDIATVQYQQERFEAAKKIYNMQDGKTKALAQKEFKNKYGETVTTATYTKYAQEASSSLSLAYNSNGIVYDDFGIGQQITDYVYKIQAAQTMYETTATQQAKQMTGYVYIGDKDQVNSLADIIRRDMYRMIYTDNSTSDNLSALGSDFAEYGENSFIGQIKKYFTGKGSQAHPWMALLSDLSDAGDLLSSVGMSAAYQQTMAHGADKAVTYWSEENGVQKVYERIEGLSATRQNELAEKYKGNGWKAFWEAYLGGELSGLGTSQLLYADKANADESELYYTKAMQKTQAKHDAVKAAESEYVTAVHQYNNQTTEQGKQMALDRVRAAQKAKEAAKSEYSAFDNAVQQVDKIATDMLVGMAVDPSTWTGFVGDRITEDAVAGLADDLHDVAKTAIRRVLDDNNLEFADNIDDLIDTILKQKLSKVVDTKSTSFVIEAITGGNKEVRDALLETVNTVAKKQGVGADLAKAAQELKYTDVIKTSRDIFDTMDSTVNEAWKNSQTAILSAYSFNVVDKALMELQFGSVGIAAPIIKFAVSNTYGMLSAYNEYLKDMALGRRPYMDALDEVSAKVYKKVYTNVEHLKQNIHSTALKLNSRINKLFNTVDAADVAQELNFMKYDVAASIVEADGYCARRGIKPNAEIAALQRLENSTVDSVAKGIADKYINDFDMAIEKFMRESVHDPAILTQEEYMGIMQLCDNIAISKGFDNFENYVAMVSISLNKVQDSTYKDKVIKEFIDRVNIVRRSMNTEQIREMENTLVDFRLFAIDNKTDMKLKEQIDYVVNYQPMFDADGRIAEIQEKLRKIADEKLVFATDTTTDGDKVKIMQYFKEIYNREVQGVADLKYSTLGQLTYVSADTATYKAMGNTNLSDILTEYVLQIGDNPKIDANKVYSFIDTKLKEMEQELTATGGLNSASKLEAMSKLYGITQSKLYNAEQFLSDDVMKLIDEFSNPYSAVNTELRKLEFLASRQHKFDMMREIKQLRRDITGIKHTAEFFNYIDNSSIDVAQRILIKDSYAGMASYIDAAYARYLKGDTSAIQSIVNKIIDRSAEHGNALSNATPNLKITGMCTPDAASNVRKMMEQNLIPEDDQFYDVYISTSTVTHSDPFAVSMCTRDGVQFDIVNKDAKLTGVPNHITQEYMGCDTDEMIRVFNSKTKVSNKRYYKDIDAQLKKLNNEASAQGKRIRFISIGNDTAKLDSTSNGWLRNWMYKNNYRQGLETFVDLERYLPGAENMVKYTQDDVVEMYNAVSDMFIRARQKYTEDVSFGFSPETALCSFSSKIPQGEAENILSLLGDIAHATNNNQIMQFGMYDGLLGTLVDKNAIDDIVSAVLGKEYHVNIPAMFEEVVGGDQFTLKTKFDYQRVADWFDVDGYIKQYSGDLNEPFSVDAAQDFLEEVQQCENIYRKIEGDAELYKPGMLEQLTKLKQNLMTMIVEQDCTPTSLMTLQWVKEDDPKRLAAVLLNTLQSRYITYGDIKVKFGGSDALDLLLNADYRDAHLFCTATNVRYNCIAENADRILKKSEDLQEILAFEHCIDSVNRTKAGVKYIRDEMTLIDSMQDSLKLYTGAEKAEFLKRLSVHKRLDEKFNAILENIADDIKKGRDTRAAKKYELLSYARDAQAKSCAADIMRMKEHEFDSFLLAQRNCLLVQPDAKYFIEEGIDVQEWIAGLGNDRHYIVQDVNINGKQFKSISVDFAQKYTSDELDILYRNIRNDKWYKPQSNVSITLSAHMYEIESSLAKQMEKLEKDLSSVVDPAERVDLKLRIHNISMQLSEWDMVDKTYDWQTLNSISKFFNGQFGSSFEMSMYKVRGTEKWAELCEQYTGATVAHTPFANLHDSTSYIANMLCDDVFVDTVSRTEKDYLSQLFTNYSHNMRNMAVLQDVKSLFSTDSVMNWQRVRKRTSGSREMLADWASDLQRRGYCIVGLDAKGNVQDYTKYATDMEWHIGDIGGGVHSPEYVRGGALDKIPDSAIVMDFETFKSIKAQRYSEVAELQLMQNPSLLVKAKMHFDRVRSNYIAGQLYLSNVSGTGLRNVIDSNIKAVNELGVRADYAAEWLQAVEKETTFENFLMEVYTKVGRCDAGAIDKYFAELEDDVTPLLTRDEALQSWLIYNSSATNSDVVARVQEYARHQVVQELLAVDQGVALDWKQVDGIYNKVTQRHWNWTRYDWETKVFTLRDEVEQEAIKAGLDAEAAATVAEGYGRAYKRYQTLADRVFNNETQMGRALSIPNKNLFEQAETRARGAMMRCMLDDGLSVSQAAKRVEATQFDYSIKTGAGKVMDYLLPFSSFQIANAKYWLDTTNYNAFALRNMARFSLATTEIDTRESVANELKKAIIKKIMAQTNNDDDDSANMQEASPLDSLICNLQDEIVEYDGLYGTDSYLNLGGKVLKLGNSFRETFEFLTDMAEAVSQMKEGQVPDYFTEKMNKPMALAVEIVKDIKDPSRLKDLDKDALAYIPIFGQAAIALVNMLKNGKVAREDAGSALSLTAFVELLGNKDCKQMLIDELVGSAIGAGLGVFNSVIGTKADTTEYASYYDRKVFIPTEDKTWYDLTDEEKKNYRYVLGVSYVPKSTITATNYTGMYATLIELGLDKKIALKILNDLKNRSTWTLNEMYWYQSDDGKWYCRTELLEQTLEQMAADGYTFEQILEVLKSTTQWYDRRTHKIVAGQDIAALAMNTAFFAAYQTLPNYMKYDKEQYQRALNYYKALGYSTGEAWILMSRDHGYVGADGCWHKLDAEHEAAYSKYAYDDYWSAQSDPDFLEWYDKLPDYIQYEKGAYSRTLKYLKKYFSDEEAKNMIMNGAYLTPDGRLIDCTDLTRKSGYTKYKQYVKKAYQDEQGYWHDGSTQPWLGMTFEGYWNTLPNFLRYTKGAWSLTNKVLKEAGYNELQRLTMMHNGSYAMEIDPTSAAWQAYIQQHQITTAKTVYVDKVVPLRQCVLDENGNYKWIDPDSLDTIEKRVEFYAFGNSLSKNYDYATVTVKVPVTVYETSGDGTVINYNGKTYVIVDSSDWQSSNRRKYYSSGRRGYGRSGSRRWRSYTPYEKTNYVRGSFIWQNQPYHIAYSNVRTWSRCHYIGQQSTGYNYWYRWGDANVTNHRTMHRSKFPSTYKNPLSRSRNMYKDLYAKYGTSRMQMRQNIQGYSNASVTRLRRNEIRNRLTSGSVRLAKTSGTNKYNKNRVTKY